MIRLISIFFLLLILSTKSFSQTYGNEWINFSQKYSKITISEEGLFKISFDAISAKGFVNGNLNPANFQLFNKGIEIPLLITGSQDGVFNQGDVIYFYGNKNDASLDRVLYNNQNDLPNEDVSLFTDDNYYFLTYNLSKNGLRYNERNQSTTGLSPESYLITKSRINFTSNYYPGEYILDAMSLSEYNEGEGYLGPTISKGQSDNYQLNTSEFTMISSYQPQLSVYIAGRSNSASSNSLGYNHHFRISLGTSILFDSLYRGYSTIRKTIPININNNNSSIMISSVDDLGAITDFQALGYLEVSYSRNFNINGLKNLSFGLDKTKTSALLNFINAGITTPVLLEKNGLNLYTPSVSNGLQFVINNTSTTTNYYLVDQTLAKDIVLNDFAFKNINSSTSNNYLIISNSALNTGATAYQQYNQSIGMPTSIVLTDDLYNEFYYGFHHPMALRNYCKFMIENGNVKPEYLLLLGKGFELAKQNITMDLVPTFGFPASDNMITSGLNGSNLEPGLATGRIPAKNNEEVENYLNKLKTYRNLNGEIWRKKLLQSTGGKTISEVTSFVNYQNRFHQNSNLESFGAFRSQIYKNVSTPITENLTERIINETRDGIALLSYFGHGSATGTEISFGKLTDQQNKEKPTIYLVNGCSTGACFTNTKSLGEEFIIGKNLGAVGWIGTTSQGVASYLGNASASYHDNWFKRFYGSSIATGIKEGLKTFQNQNDKLNRAHTSQYIFLGDPTLKFYAPEKPDFNIEASSLYLKQANQNATAQTLELNLKIENLGKTINDSLSIKINRILPDNSTVSIPVFKIKPVFNTDTISISLSNIGVNVAGINKISVKIDDDNKFLELNEQNNQVTLETFLPGNGVKNIFPINNGIFSQNRLVLKAQPDNLFTKSAEYLFEIDTTADFNSGLKKTSNIIVANIFPEWTPNINLENGKVYFWRAKLNLPMDKGGNWTLSSFTYLPAVADGFSQSHQSQLKNVTLDNIVFDNQTGNFDFTKTYYPTSIYTEGDDGLSPNEKRFRTTQSISFSNSAFEGFTLAAMSNFIPGIFFSYPSPFNSTNGPVLVNGYTGQYFWNINDPVQVDSLIRFINQIPDNYHVIGFNGTNATINALPLAAKNALKLFGLSKFELINKGEPYMFWGTKNSPSGSALEFTADYTSQIPARSQSLQHFLDLPFPLGYGSIKSELIGPAKEWENVSINFNKSTSDIINYDLIGVNKQGLENILISNIVDDEFSITNINAKEYPFIKLKSNIYNKVNYKFPKLKYWNIAYKPFSEISVNPDHLFNFHSEKIAEGDSLKFTVSLSNIYIYPTDSVKASIELTGPNRQTSIKNFNLAPIIVGENTSIYFKESTRNLVGKNSLKLQLNSSNEDLYTFNNTLQKEFEVIKDSKESLINVLFDGKSIINGEIISPKPVIAITNIDDNKFLLLNDTTNLDIYLKKESENDYKRIAYSSSLLSFTPSATAENNSSKVEFRPDLLPDGIHSLKVKGKDVTGNFNQNDYVIDFEVVNNSSISNFYPYPNPVVNSMKFVFTLTGLKIPDKIKIMIYNASGKIIRVISKEELGSIKIGNNISDFTWDGTDEFGDSLANGVYFYRVDISNATEIKHRNTSGDTLFKNNMGKIYLMK
ncbi:putative type IX secretion system sortase PorU2 [Pedobacter cryophilus]|uniref:T9SS type A sorting domain-containing protein n=1 Tax=Pedobacter cryophilus TaxID=2571271 RepID=A0A4U1BUX0_9SPHI|nr:C25 family cysteine peptidase [Pedobacter cryophilus]TKB96062.1 T9SS type A sorting domain-containing protein [Pedobacter cryophilus]